MWRAFGWSWNKNQFGLENMPRQRYHSILRTEIEEKHTHTHSHSLTCRWMMIMWNRTFKFHANKNKRAAVSLSRSATLRSYVFSHPSYLYRKRAWPILIGTFTIRSGCRSSRFFHCQISTFSSSCEVCDNCRLSFFFHWLTRAHTLAHLFSAGGWTFSIQEI